MIQLTEAVASAKGLHPEDSAPIANLVYLWREKYQRNRLRDAYYYGHVEVKDLGISVSPALVKKLRPHVDWAAKCVDWWSDRVQFDGVTVDNDVAQATIENTLRANDSRNLLHKTISVALRHSCAFLTVTAGENGQVVLSGYPATAAAAEWDDEKKRIKRGLVVVAADRPRGSRTRYPRLINVFDDDNVIVLSRDGANVWHAQYIPHGMGRVPMEPIAYHATLERPFGRSRITRTVMSLVDDAQREMMNMAAAASFSAAPMKYLMGVDKGTAKKISESRFDAFMGAILTATTNSKGQIPQIGQLAQLSMQPHIEYMRSLAAQFSSSTGVPLSSLGVVSDNPSSADAIYASKEDAVVDIQSYIDACKRAMQNVCTMILAANNNTSFDTESANGFTIDVHFRKPDRPSTISQSQAIMSQIQAIPWLADSDVTLRELGYDDEQVHQLRTDRRRAQALQGASTFLDRNQVNNADQSSGTEQVSQPDQTEAE